MEKIRLTDSSSSIQRHLSEDIWCAIFLYLPLDSIFKLRCVCKVWLSLLSNPNFLNHWYKLSSSSLWAFIHGSRLGIVPNNPDAIISRFSCPELNSQFISYHENVSGLSFRFVNNKADLSNTNLFVLGCSNGLVLCATSYFNQETYYVCNPLTKKWVLLPPPPKIEIIAHTGFTCDGDSASFSSSLVSSSFKVIRVDFDGSGYSFEIDIFSSDLGEWNVYNVSCLPGVAYGYTIYDNYFTCNGVFYWMRKSFSDVLAFNVNRISDHETYGDERRRIKLPEPMNGKKRFFGLSEEEENEQYFSQCLGQSEGLICYAEVGRKKRSLSVWVLEEDWILLHKDTEFYDMLAQMDFLSIGEPGTVDLREIQVLGFNPDDKYVVIFGYMKYIWSYNIRTRGYEQLSHPSFLDSSLLDSYSGVLTFPFKPRPTILPTVRW